MIGLSILVFAIIWVVFGIFLGRRLHGWLKLDPKWKTLVVWLVVLAPVVQEVLGRIQFAYLCNKHAVVWLSPDWQGVKAARASPSTYTDASLTVMPIQIKRYEYIDLATGQAFGRVTSLSTHGGFFLGTLGLGLGRSTSCRPANQIEISKMIDIDNLIKKGESK